VKIYYYIIVYGQRIDYLHQGWF